MFGSILRTRSGIGAVLLAIFVVILFIRSLSIPLLITEDGREYLEYSSLLASGQWKQLNEFNRCVLRSPLYPILIAFGKLLFGDSVQIIRILHLLVGLATISLTSRLLGSLRSGLMIAFIAFAVLVQAQVFFLSALTEWSAICLLITLFACLVKYISSPTPVQLFFVTLLCALALLLRSALLPFCVLPIILLLASKSNRNRRNLAAVALGFIPVIFLLSLNRIYFQTTGISPLGGIALLGMSTLIEEPPLTTSASAELKEFATRFDAVKFPRLQGNSRIKFPTNIEAIANRNMWDAGESVRTALGWSYTKYSQVGAEYGMSVIRQNPWAYSKLVIAQFVASFRFLELADWILVICWAWCVYSQISSPKLRPVVISSIIFAVAHLISVLFCSLMNPSIYRHVAATLIPFQFCMYLLCLITLISLRNMRKQLYKTSPQDH